jgi:hypothetical protein
LRRSGHVSVGQSKNSQLGHFGPAHISPSVMIYSKGVGKSVLS